jgi:hypothetical protein
MFESSYLNLLQASGVLCSLVSTYSGQPSIFSYQAPEDAEPPYLVFRRVKYFRIESNLIVLSYT